MQSEKITLYSLSFVNSKSYLLTAAFVAGNIILPQICHLIPQGGLILLPIYFFTLIGAYKYGWRVGLLTALISPIINHLLFGMPTYDVLPLILAKSTILAIAAGLAANYLRHISIYITLSIVVATYQLVGTIVEWAIIGDIFTALQGFRVGIIGMMMQVIGGGAIISHLLRK